ncbi:hypothetical protein PUN28_002095 [Cardiocondyla obscurior]|uniref:DUF7041 domain-containing protein n=1 Tax=Cardiocondyla obscurior TaxID=286306 RepID=A0AAW2GSP5_9HYME
MRRLSRRDCLVLNSEETSELAASCRLPAFWKDNPELWFFQVEAIFQIHRIVSDSSKFNMVVAKLDVDSLQEVADIIKKPPASGKYNRLKASILERLSDSADRQLRKLLTQLELGDRKPSQLLRHMRTLAGDRATEAVLRVKWLDLLPASSQRLLRIFHASMLDKLATAADEMMDSGSQVMVISQPPKKIVKTETTATPAPATFEAVPSPSSAADLADAISACRVSLSKLISLNRNIFDLLKANPSSERRSRSRKRPRSRSVSTPPSTRSDKVCYYHRRWRKAAKNCQQPCDFQAASSPVPSGN